MIVDCRGDVIERCGEGDACDTATTTCMNACEVAAREPSSMGCEFYATPMDSYEFIIDVEYACFTAIVVNTSAARARIGVSYAGNALPVASFARVAASVAHDLELAPYDEAEGLAPGGVAILFLTGRAQDPGLKEAPGSCPVEAAVPDAAFEGTGIGHAFRVTTDAPVSMYQLHPWGGGRLEFPGGSMLLPTSAWGMDYIAVNAGPRGEVYPSNIHGLPSLNIIAQEDETRVTLVPVAAVEPGTGVPGGPANEPLEIVLDAGQHVQLTQVSELSGSLVSATRPIGFMAGHQCLDMPVDIEACDHAMQMTPPTYALGHRYVGVMYPPRAPGETSTFWRMVGVVDGTLLSYSTNVGGPTRLDRGEVVNFETGTPFVVSSQDADHPFLLFTYMTGAELIEGLAGDPEFVLNVAPSQYLDRYVLLADPSYTDTRLVVVRSRGSDGEFADVYLDCRGLVQGWQPVGGDFEYAHVTITAGSASIDGCTTGRLELESHAPFSVTLWGWRGPWGASSYGFPGGMRLTPNDGIVIR